MLEFRCGRDIMNLAHTVTEHMDRTGSTVHIAVLRQEVINIITIVYILYTKLLGLEFRITKITEVTLKTFVTCTTFII